jgi:hypothetical protein
MVSPSTASVTTAGIGPDKISAAQTSDAIPALSHRLRLI